MGQSENHRRRSIIAIYILSFFIGGVLMIGGLIISSLLSEGAEDLTMPIRDFFQYLLIIGVTFTLINVISFCLFLKEPRRLPMTDASTGDGEGNARE